MSDVKFVNQVKVAGLVKSLTVNEDRAFFLVQASDKQDDKWIPCTIYKEKEPLRKISYFQEGDYIQLTGSARPWSQKVGQEWKNNMDIRVAIIHNEQTKRAPAPPPQAQSEPVYDERNNRADDDIPF